MTRPAVTSNSTRRTGHGLRPKLEFLAALMLTYTAHAQTPSVAVPSGTKVDWTPLFVSWERGCSGNPAFDDVVSGLEEGKVVLPLELLGSAGPISRSTVQEEVNFRVTLQGMYHGLPVKTFERYRGIENGINGYALVLAVPRAFAQKALTHVDYQPDDEAGFRAIVVGSDEEAELVCDRSM